MSRSGLGNRLEIDRVVKHFQGTSGETIRAVDGVTLHIAPGEILALRGPSGSGKSTLLMIAAGLLAADHGAVRLDGEPLPASGTVAAALHLRHRVGVIHQHTHLMAGVPAAENAAIKLLADRATLRDARETAVRWLSRVGLAHRVEHTPEKLSGGERQRVAIARALITQPALILADEPTGNLDSHQGGEILALLKELCETQHAALLLVTHDPDAAAVADRVCLMRDGKILETSPAQVSSAAFEGG